MSLIDRRVEAVQALNDNIRQAVTFGAWLGLVQQQHALKKVLAEEEAEVRRLARGWTYIPPPTVR